MKIKELEQLGLTSGEARTYLALLELKSSTVGAIIKKSKVASSKIYSVLERLIQKGLISFITKEKIKHYTALPPNRLEEYIDKKEKEILENKQLLKSLMPELENLSDKNKEENVQIFKGIKGIITAYEMMLDSAKTNSTIKYFYAHQEHYSKEAKEFYVLNSKFPELLKKYYKEKRIKFKGILDNTDVVKKGKHMEIKESKFPLMMNADFNEEYVLMISWEGSPMGVLIRSKEFAKNLEIHFDFLWKQIK
jgi:HTH-type transcriptional regulator, sugar sensing transcriptional regulator